MTDYDLNGAMLLQKASSINLCLAFASIVWALIIRAFLSVFKAAAIRQGEAGEESKKLSFWKAWCQSFSSWSGNSKKDDYWLPFFVGWIELYFYPILMVNASWQVIGFWIGVKTASQWRTWGRSRTPYNRFLLGNLLGLVVSLFLSRLVKV